MNLESNATAVLAVMVPLNIGAAIFCAMVCFEWAMDWLDDNSDPDGWL